MIYVIDCSQLYSVESCKVVIVIVTLKLSSPLKAKLLSDINLKLSHPLRLTTFQGNEHSNTIGV